MTRDQLPKSNPLHPNPAAEGVMPPPYSSKEPSQTTDQAIEYNDGVLVMNFLKDRSGPDGTPLFVPDFTKDGIPWYAELVVHPSNMVALMREALHWSDGNIDITKSYLRPALSTDTAEDYGFTQVRYYMLESSSSTAWRAELRVFGFDIQPLRDFRPYDLTHENVRYAYAFNRYSDAIYNFDSADESLCYNATLDLTPLPGLWPWPKANKHATVLGSEDK